MRNHQGSAPAESPGEQANVRLQTSSESAMPYGQFRQRQIPGYPSLGQSLETRRNQKRINNYRPKQVRFVRMWEILVSGQGWISYVQYVHLSLRLC